MSASTRSTLCPNCGAPHTVHDPTEHSKCEYCDHLIAATEQKIIDAQVIETFDPHAELRRELELTEQQLVKATTKIMGAVLLILLPGVAIAVPSGVVFGLQEMYFPMVAGIVLGSVIGASGILAVVYLGTEQSRLEKKIKDIEQRMGKDTRNLAEKVFDGGMQFLFGKRK